MKVYCKKLRPIIIGVILLLFVLFNYSVFSNLHLHYLGNNYYIVHAHPFDKSHNKNSPIKTHQHSNIELLILSLLSIIELIVILLGIFIFLEKSSIYLNRYNKSIIPITTNYTLPVLRGPPFC